VAAVVFLSASPARAIEMCNPVSTPMTTLACKEGGQGDACDSPLVKTGESACTVLPRAEIEGGVEHVTRVADVCRVCCPVSEWVEIVVPATALSFMVSIVREAVSYILFSLTIIFYIKQ